MLFLQGMFDLSKFMIGSGSDGDSEHNPVPHKSESQDHEELEPRVENIADGQAEEQEAEERSNADLDSKVQLSNNDIDSPQWSDDDLQSWQSNTTNQKQVPMTSTESNKILVCATESENEENYVIHSEKQPQLFNNHDKPICDEGELQLVKSKTMSEELSEDSFLPVENTTFINQIPAHTAISPYYSSPEFQEIPEPKERPSKKKQILTASQKNNINDKIDNLKSKIEILSSNDNCIIDKESDYSDLEDSVSADDEDMFKKEPRSMKRTDLKALLLKEKLKKSNISKIVSKLKEHKKEQQILIDNLVCKNKELDLEVTKHQILLKKNSLKCELSDAHLKTVKSLKGNLLEDIENQNSLILDKINEVNQLKLDLKEYDIKYNYLNEKYKKAVADKDKQFIVRNEDDILSIEKRNADLMDKLEELDKKFQSRESQLLEERNNAMDVLNEENRLQIKNIQADLVEKLAHKDDLIEDLQKDINNQKVLRSDIDNKFKGIEDENLNLQEKIKVYVSQITNLENSLSQKEEEIIMIEKNNKDDETIESLKKQFSHMADTYENKINRLAEESEASADEFNQERNSLLQTIREKDDLINHLKKDLSNIKEDFKERLKIQENKMMEETEELKIKLNTLEIDNQNTLIKMSEQNIKMSENESLLAHCKEENIKLTKDLEMISQNNTKLQDSLDEMQEDKKQFLASIPGKVSEDKIKSNEELLDQIDALKHDVQNYKSNSEEKDREIKELKKDVKTKHEKIVTLENEERLR